MNTTIRFQWDDSDLRRNITRIQRNLVINEKEAVDQFGDAVITAVRYFTPRKTGETQASFGKYDPELIDTIDPKAHSRAKRAAVYELKSKNGETTLRIGTTHPRFFYLNYGTSKLRPYHMAERGQALARAAFKPLVQRAIDASIRDLRSTPGGQKRWQYVKAQRYVPKGLKMTGGLGGRRVRISKV